MALGTLAQDILQTRSPSKSHERNAILQSFPLEKCRCSKLSLCLPLSRRNAGIFQRHPSVFRINFLCIFIPFHFPLPYNCDKNGRKNWTKRKNRAGSLQLWCWMQFREVMVVVIIPLNNVDKCQGCRIWYDVVILRIIQLSLFKHQPVKLLI